MWFEIGISILIGAALAQRFDVFILIPTIVLATIITALIEIAHGASAWATVGTIALVCTALQMSYLIGSIVPAAVARRVRVPILNPLVINIQQHMEVVGSDGQHVGTIDHTENASRIVLTADDPKADGRPHLISVNWVDYVDSKVHLNRTSGKVVTEWQVAA